MAITYKIMKTLTRPDGDNKVRYEVFDSAGRKMIAPDWYKHEDEAFTAGQHIVKDGILYRFLVPHTAETEWNSNEVTAVDVGEEIEAIVISLNGKIPTTAKGVANGVAELDSTGKVPAAQLPSYVDDVQEYSDQDHFPVTGSTGVIYVAIDTNKTYRWSGSAYVEISESLALGETSSTAFRGDHGKTAYDHATDANRLTTEQAEGLYKVSVSNEGHVKSVTAVQKEDITKLGIPAQDTTYSPATQSANGLMSSQDKTKLDGIDMSTKVNTSDFYATEMPVSESDSTKVATALSDIKSQIDGKASIIHDTVQNVAIASVPDAAANLPLSALKFKVEPIQSGSGDPYPGGGSPQRWDEEWEVGNYDSTTGEKSVANNQIRSKNYIPVLPSTTYYFKTATNSRVLYYDTNKGYLTSELKQNATFTTPADCYYVNFHLGTSYGTTYNNDVAINYSSTDTAYHAWRNIRPITGRTSAVVSQSKENILNETDFEDGKWINATTGEISSSSSVSGRKCTVNFQKCVPNTGYFVNLQPASGQTLGDYSALIAWYDENQNFISSVNYQAYNTVLTSPAHARFFRFGCLDKNAPHAWVNYPSNFTAYTAYTGTTATVQFGSTVFGGEVNWVGAECADGAEYVTFNGEETWKDNGANGYFTSIDPKYDVNQTPTFDYLKALSKGGGAGLGTWQGRLNLAGSTGSSKVLLVKPDMSVYDTKEKWATYLSQNPLHAVLWLAEPNQITLTGLDTISTPLNGGTMNLWSDSGDIVEMTYPCDTKGYIDKKITELTALVLES